MSAHDRFVGRRPWDSRNLTLVQPEPARARNRTLDRLEQLVDVGVALSRETDTERLLEAILIAAKRITGADGGTLYRVTEERTLVFEIMRTDSLGIAMGGTTGVAVPFAPLPLFDNGGQPILSNVVAYAYHHDCPLNIADAYFEEGFDFSGTRSMDAQTGYRSQSFLTVPMKNHENEIIGVLQLLNAIDRNTGSVATFSEEDERFAVSLASQAAIALTNRQLIDHTSLLFESFISLINKAIDDKSHHTGQHCERVPALTMMLAEAVNACHVGPLKNFNMTDKDRFELKIAGLLHDCGKIATPVHVIDKGTKLQTIFDRMNVVDTRFEVVKRDAEILALRAELAALARGDASCTEAIRRHLADTLEAIDNDREFLHVCNVGVERMQPEDIARVRAISSKYARRDETGVETPFLSNDEIENLTIEKGTLTAAERQIINRHIDLSIQMLEAMPWPKHLKHVPEYAGGHHERMDGKGYPRGLTREQMSVQARCMGIADIFEALTAKDRPYKKGKTLSESLTILGNLKLSGQIDPDLFDVFMWEGVYLHYAWAFMDHEQIDKIDLARIPGYVPRPNP